MMKTNKLMLGPGEFCSYRYAIKRIFDRDVCENREQ